MLNHVFSSVSAFDIDITNIYQKSIVSGCKLREKLQSSKCTWMWQEQQWQKSNSARRHPNAKIVSASSFSCCFDTPRTCTPSISWDQLCDATHVCRIYIKTKCELCRFLLLAQNDVKTTRIWQYLLSFVFWWKRECIRSSVVVGRLVGWFLWSVMNVTLHTPCQHGV